MLCFRYQIRSTGFLQCSRPPIETVPLGIVASIVLLRLNLVLTNARHTNRQSIRVDRVQGTFSFRGHTPGAGHIPLASARGVREHVEWHIFRTVVKGRFGRCGGLRSCRGCGCRSCCCCGCRGRGGLRCRGRDSGVCPIIPSADTDLGTITVHGLDVEYQWRRTGHGKVFTIDAHVEAIAMVRMRHIHVSFGGTANLVQLQRNR